MNTEPPGNPHHHRESHPHPSPELDELVLLDQLSAVRKSVLFAIPVNVLLGVACTLVAFSHERAVAGLLWFAMSTAANALRIGICRLPPITLAASEAGDVTARHAATLSSAQRQVRRFSAGALLSGLVWAGVPLLCDGYTSSATLFYLTVVCGVTSGAVTYGTAYARVPLAFITPTLLSVIACLLYNGTFDRYCLAATVFLYLLALVRSALQGEATFKATSHSKNLATAMARTLEEANRQATAARQLMQHQAWHDALTGLLNRAGFVSKAEQHISQAHGSVCLMLMDLDGFKAVNDIYGHKAGDEVLVEVARRLNEQKPPNSWVGRLGGDEFALFFTTPLSSFAVDDIAKRLIDTVPLAIPNAGRLGVSIGICQIAGQGLTEMLTCADDALYAAKNAGRNQYVVFDQHLRTRLDLRRAIERDLPSALTDRSLEVFFQPVLRAEGAFLDSVEALLRWKHPVHGWIPPEDIVFIAATTGQSEPLLHYVLDAVCRLMQRLQAAGFADVRVAMNVSPRKMAQIPVDVIVLNTLARRGLSPRQLEIEITEETTADIEIVQSRLNCLSAAGIRIAVDDFGVGFSSLSSLLHAYVDKVKIDRSLIVGISPSTENRALVEAIVNLGAFLRIDVVAEGVEQEIELRTLSALGCDLIQGYHLARPMPMDEVISWARNRWPDPDAHRTAPRPRLHNQ